MGMNFTQEPVSKKGGVSYGVLALIIFLTLVVAFVVFRNLDRIGGWIGGSETTSGTHLTIGQSVVLSGSVVQNGDYVSYTHTITTSEYGVVGIKSKTIDLNQYTGAVLLQGIVTKQLNDLYIVEVTGMTGSLAVATGADTLPLGQEGTYIANAGLYFSPAFGANYALTNNGEGGEVTLLHTSTNQAISIAYFACTTNDSDKNCAQLTKTFAASAEKSFSTSNGDKYYKLEGINSWFVSNANLYGYFINDIPEQEVKDLSAVLGIMSESFVKASYLRQIQSLCTDGTVALSSVGATTLGKDMNGLYLGIQGTTANGTAQCKVVLDPSLSTKGRLLSFVPSQTTPTTPGSTSSSASSSDLDFSVKQFPTSAEKTLSYTSSRGHSITFPSRSISYGAVSLDGDLDINGVHCTAQMNVVAYTNKDFLATEPMVKIWECTAKKAVSLPSDAYLQTTLSDGRVFIIKIMNGAWKDFASKIVVSM